MADRYWVGGTANWDGTAGTKWATSSGGTGGASVPTTADNVFFDASSGAGTVTIGANASALNLDCTGFTGTLSLPSVWVLSVNGNLTFSAGMTFSGTSTATLSLNGSGTHTVTTSGKSIGCLVVFGNTNSGSWSLQDAFTTTQSITVVRGTFDTNNFNVTASSLSSSNSNTRTINLGSSTITVSATSPWNFGANANLTFNAGTSTIVCSSATTVSFVGGGSGGVGVTFYNLSFTGTSVGTKTFQGVNTFNNITVSGPASAGVVQVAFGDNQTINGTLSTTGTAGNCRVWFRSGTYGIAQTLTINATPSLTDADFRDIYVIGTAAPISGTRIGDLRGIRGITASTPKTVYWNLAAGGNWSANAWAASSGGGVSTDNFPLAQDTAVIENTGLNTSATVTLDNTITYTGTFDMSARTNAVTISPGVGYTLYGDWKSGSGTTLIGSSAYTFSGRNTQTITSAGKTFSGGITVDSYGGTVELADALNIGTNTLSVVNGTFDTKNYNVTAGALSSSNSNVRTITLGSSTVTLSGSTVINFSTTTNLTFNAGTSQINTSVSGAATITGGGNVFYNVSFNLTSTGSHIINGVNTFNNLSVTSPSSAGLIQLLLTANQTITGTLTCAGATAVRRIFLRSDTLGTTRTLTVGTLSATDCDFRDITIAGAASGSSPTRAGDCGGNSGITFPAAKTVYWNLAGTQDWSATAWATGSGGTPAINNFPLAQDTAVFDNTGSVGTITSTASWNIGTINASARTSAMTLSITGSASSPVFYKDLTLGTGVTVGGASTGAYVFSGRGTQTITSNGVALSSFVNVTIDCFTGTVQLADALSLNSARTLTLTSGTFDAVSYNVTTGLFNSGGGTLKMGSATWTLSGTGTVWNYAAGTLYKGTANIVLSDTSTTGRTFNSGGLSYNKLTIGGTTGTSTLTFSSTGQYTEIASTKTVAHTIAFGTNAQTFGKWTVTGTSGNVVTVTGTATITIVGACVSGVDYLALGTTTVSATSPGEFYAGANSTATGVAAPLYLTAKPADSTRYWVGGTGNWSDTARWSTSSGGGGGASVPRSHDDVVFDAASNATAYTATVDAVTGGIRCKSLTIAGPTSGNLTLAGTTAIVGIHGNVTLPATGLTRTYTGNIILTGSTTGKTLTTNGVALESGITVNGVDCEWSLGSALNNGTSTVTVTNGNLLLSTYNLTASTVQSDNANSRTVNFGSGTVALSASTPINFGTTESNRAALTLTAGTGQINLSNTSPTFSGNNQTFYNVSFTSTSAGTVTINGANSFNNLSFTGITSAGLKNISLTANQTITGTLTLSAGTNATMRHFVRSDAIGTTRTLTCAAVASLTDIDFRDITIAGAAAPVSGTRLGDCKGNSGITFDAAKTVYWNFATTASWSGVVWASSIGGTPDNIYFPLAQDTIVFPSSSPNSGVTVSLGNSYNIGTIDMSARTSNTMTLATSTNTPTIYGNWINGTGTTLTGTGTMTFAGRGSQTITSAGKTFTQQFTVNTPGGTVSLQDALTLSQSVSTVLTLTSGTFDASSYNVSLSGAAGGFSSSNSNTRTIAIGSGTWSIGGTSTWTITGSPTITGTGTISLTSGSTKTFLGGGLAYTNITLDQGGAGALTISGNNTFKDITNTYSATGATTITIGTTTQRVSQWTATGAASKVLTVQGTSASSPGTLILTGGTDPNVDYLAITGVRAYSLTDTWYAGTNSTNNGSLGWYFESGVIVITASVSESSRASDSLTSLATLNITLTETASTSDTVASTGVLNSVLSESATAADIIDAIKLYLASVAESATSADLVSAARILAAAISELATAAETVNAKVQFASQVLESASAADSASSLRVLLSAVLESATAQEITSAVAAFSSASSESARAADTTTVTASTFNAAASDTARALDAPSALVVFPTSVAELATGADTASAAFLPSVTIAESVTASETTASFVIFAALNAETARATDTALVAASTFNAAASDTAQVADSQNAPGSIYNVTLPESAAATDTILGAFLWNLIDDDQSPSWVVISIPQNPNWSIIDDSQSPNWQNISNI